MKVLGIVVSAVIVFVVGFAFIAGMTAPSHCQYYDEEDRQISEMSSSLESEMEAQRAESAEEMEEMDESMRGNQPPLGAADY